MGCNDICQSGAQALTAITLSRLGYEPFLDYHRVCDALVAEGETFSILEFEGDSRGNGYNVSIQLHADTSSKPAECFQLDEYDEWGNALTYMQQVKDEITGGVL